MQQQQQTPDYDLLAVFPDETRAEAATAKLLKEGFSDEEVHQLTSNTAGKGQFREHGPSSARAEYFLQTRRTGPNPVVTALFGLLFAAIAAGIVFGATFVLPQLNTPIIFIIGVVIGLASGIVFAVVRGGKVRGDIGQNRAPAHAPPAQSQSSSSSSSGRTIVALRLNNPENISRRTRARAILINNQGKIDRSVGQRE